MITYNKGEKLMKISQVNNQQTNFKGGLVGRKGAADLVLEQIPSLAGRVAEGLIERAARYDYFVFSPAERDEELAVAKALRRSHYEVMQLGDSSIPLTMKELKAKMGE